MIYCRFSDCGYQSDVYAYEDVAGGFTVHIASYRYDRAIPEHDFSSVEAMNASNVRRKEVFGQAKRLPTGLPLAGATFHCGSLEMLLARLQELRAAGYRVPQHAIDLVVEEMNGDD